MAIVTDMTGHGDVLGQIDDEIKDWREPVDRPSYGRRAWAARRF